jgi:hypothetical protein
MTKEDPTEVMKDMEGGGGNHGLSHGDLDDPFAARKGRALVWKNVCMTLAGKGSEEPAKELLKDVWGEVPPHQTTAMYVIVLVSLVVVLGDVLWHVVCVRMYPLEYPKSNFLSFFILFFVLIISLAFSFSLST